MLQSQISSSTSDLFSDSTSASSINAFHKPKRSTVLIFPERDSDHTPNLSPSLEGFSFTDDLPNLQPRTSPREKIPFDLDSAPYQPYAGRIEDSQLKRASGMSQNHTISRIESSRQRAQYYEDSLTSKDGHGQSSKERIQKDSPVIAELRTNVIIKDEFTVVTQLSQHLSERYRRPESAILITITHSACLMMGGSFDPAYLLTISAIPSEVQSVTNKRNAFLMQHFVADTLHVPSSRGIVRFQEVLEERLASNGSTVASEIERLDTNEGNRSTPSKSSRKSLITGTRKSFIVRKTSDELERKVSTKSTKSVKPMKSSRDSKEIDSPPIPLHFAPELRSSHMLDGCVRESSPTPVLRVCSPSNSVYELSSESTTTQNKLSDTNSVNDPSRPSTANRPASSLKHLSIMTGNVRDFPAPPPVPHDLPTHRVSKRKSLIAMFKRADSKQR